MQLAVRAVRSTPPASSTTASSTPSSTRWRAVRRSSASSRGRTPSLGLSGIVRNIAARSATRRGRGAGGVRGAGRDGRPGRRAGTSRAGERRDGEIVGSRVAGRDRGRCAGPARERAWSTEGSGTSSPSAATSADSCSTADQSALNSARTRAVSRAARSSTSAAAQTYSMVSSASSGSGKRSTRSHCSTDAPSTSSISRTRQLHQVFALERHRELVDRDVLAALEHVDADDVGADRADAGRDETERARTVGKPHAHDEPNDV